MPANSKIKLTAYLAQIPLFSDFEPEDLHRIAEQTRELHVPRGEILFNRGDPCHGFHTVVFGRVKLLFLSSVGTEKVVELIGPGHSFGEAVMFMDKPYIVAAQTLADSFLLHVSKEAVLAEIERTPRFARKMLGGLSRRLHGLITDVEAYSLSSGTQRVIGYLLKESVVDGEEVTLHASKAVVASRLNLTPEHFSRILHDLTEHQLIKVNGRSITMLSVERLRNYQK